MKTFGQYLTENAKEFRFRIKLAKKPDADLVNLIKQTLECRKVLDFGSVKSEIIRKMDPFFPTLDCPEVYSLDVILQYPTTATEIREMLGRQTIELTRIAVVNKDHDDDLAIENTKVASNLKNALLMSPYEKTSSPAPYGDDYNTEMVKNAVTGKVSIPGAPKLATTNQVPGGKKSPVGSTKNVIPKVKSFAR